MNLFQIVKAPKSGKCSAKRCPGDATGTVSLELWGGNPVEKVDLCTRHLAEVESYAMQQGASSTEITVVVDPDEGVRLVGFSGAVAFQEWLEKIRVAIGDLKEQALEAQEVLRELRGFKISSQERLEDAAEWARDAKKSVQDLAALEKTLAVPLTKALGNVRELCLPARQGWADVEHKLRTLLEAAALHQEDTNREVQQAANAAVESGADPREALSKMVHAKGLSGVSLKVVWKAVVERLDLLPAPYVVKSPDYKKLKEYCAAVPEGQEPEPILGVRFEKDVDSRITANKEPAA